MTKNKDCVAILGLGLMGGSLGLALRAQGLAARVAGYDAAPGVPARARERGALDEACDSVAEAVAGASLIVLAAPVLALRALLVEIAPHLAPNAIVTDLGSVKTPVVAWAEELLPDPARFVAGHPMAGKEHAGIEAADAALFGGCVWCLTPTARTDPSALQSMEDLIRRLGAHPRRLDAARHDAAVAAISHLPLVAASALVQTAAERPAWPAARELAAGGFRDTTRVASGDPRMARDISLANTAPLLACLDAYIETLAQLRAHIASGDPTIEVFFAEAKRTRDDWLTARTSQDQPST